MLENSYVSSIFFYYSDKLKTVYGREVGFLLSPSTMAFSFNSTPAQKPAPFAFGSSGVGGFGTTATNPSTGKRVKNLSFQVIKFRFTSSY